MRSAPGSPERLRYPSAVSRCVGALRGQVTLARDARRRTNQSIIRHTRHSKNGVLGPLDTENEVKTSSDTSRKWTQDVPHLPDAGLRCILHGARLASVQSTPTLYTGALSQLLYPVGSEERVDAAGPTCCTLLLLDRLDKDAQAGL